MNRKQQEQNESASRMDAVIAKVALVVLAALFIIQFLGK